MAKDQSRTDVTTTAEKRHQTALEHLGRGDPDAALTAIEQSLAADFSWAASHATHGLVLATKGDNAAAERAVSAALKLDPQLPYAHFAQGVLIQDEHPEQAVQAFTRALEGDPDNPRFLLQLAVSHLKAGDRETAHSRLMAALEHDPGNTTALILLADLSLAQGRWDEATALTDQILAVEPEHRDALLVRAQLSLLQGDAAVLERCAGALLDKEPDNKRALELAALGSLSRGLLWRPWWLFMVWRARSDQRRVTLLALLGLGGILALSFLLVAVAPNLAVAFHGLLWLLFGYLVGAHFSLRARARHLKGRGRRGERDEPDGDLGAEDDAPGDEPGLPEASGRSQRRARPRRSGTPRGGRTLH